MTSKKRNIVLKNIDINATNLKYGLVIISNIEKDKYKETKTTKITDVISPDIENSISFLDENKKDIKCSATMIGIMINKDLPKQTNINCFWCRHSFTTHPIGCPIRYINPSIEKSYISHITKDKYYMKENITPSKLKNILSQEETHFEIIPFVNDYYLTDGIFCSFNCVLAFIKDNNHDIFYRESRSLLHSLYESLIGFPITKIVPSPHWRLLKEYGGHLTIEEYRNSFNNVEYDFMFNLREMRTISKIYKET